MNYKPDSLNRRNFIKSSGIAAISVAAIATGASSSSVFAGNQGLANPTESKSIGEPVFPGPVGQRTTFHVLDYYRPGMTDAAVIQSAIDAAIASAAPADVVLENKTYHVDQTIRIYRANDLTLNGNGAKLVMTKYVMSINVNDCARTRLTNMTFDYDPLPFTQGEVVKIDTQAMTYDVRIDAGYPGDPQFMTMLKTGSSLVVDQKQRIIKQGSAGGGAISSAERQADGVVRVTGGRSAFDGLEVGDVVVLVPQFIFGGKEELGKDFFNRYFYFQHSTIRMINTEACGTDRLTFHTGPSALYDYMGNGGNSHTNNSVVPGPRPAGAVRDRQLSVTLDVFQSCGKKKGPLVENWLIDRSHDDGIVLWGYFSKIIEQPVPDRVIVTPIYRDIITAGDLIEIRDIDDQVKGTARVSSMQTVHRADLAGKNSDIHEKGGYPLPYPWTPEDFLELKLDKNIPAAQLGDRIIALNRRNQGAVIRNNHIRGIRARGIKIRATDVLVENNLVEDTTMSGIELAAERELLMLGAPQENIVIRGNRIRNISLYKSRGGPATVVTNAGIRLIHCGKTVNDQYSRESFSKVIANRNITIENNLIENTPYYAILCANASQVVIRDNVIRDANMMEPQTNALGFKPESAILVAASDHVTVGNNKITSGKYGKKEVDVYDSTAVKVLKAGS
ncbi:MAG: right-handed parallel beta-helix repeat-containing protein, partial [Desulfuromonadales bacterium]